jgi:hypothetical protein
MIRNMVFCSLLFIMVFYLSCNSDFPATPLQDKTLNSLVKINSYPFYTMTYYGDYGFSHYLKTGSPISKAGKPSNGNEYSCSSFSSFGTGSDYLFGRNHDWHNHAAMLVYTHPPDGYASMSMSDIGGIGYSPESPADSFEDRKKLLYSPFTSVDGMNEYGVAIGEMSVDHAEPPFDPQRRTISSNQVIRLVLDYARDVDEAIKLLSKYNVNFGDGEKGHFLIADSSGHSAVIEFLDNDIKIIRNCEKWQVSTNFIIYGTDPSLYEKYQSSEGWSSNFKRYNMILRALKNNYGKITPEDAMDILHSVSANFAPPINVFTQWSVVYNLKTLEVYVVTGLDYSNIHRFSLRAFN